MTLNELPFPPFLLNEFGLQRAEWFPVLGAIKLVTDRGVFALKETKASESNLAMLNHFMLQMGDECPLVPFTPNKYRDPFIVDWENNWYVTVWQEEHPWQVKTARDGIHLIEACANLHRKSSFMRKETFTSRSFIDRIGDFWQNELNEIEAHINREGDSYRQLESPLSYVIMKSKEAVQLLQSHLARSGDQLRDNSAICHGRIHPLNTIGSGTKIRFIDYDHISYDHPLRDLAYFFRRQHSKFRWHSAIGHRWLSSYNRINPLTKEEVKYLGILLMFPQKLFAFLKQTDTESRGNKSWNKDFEALFTEYHFMQRFARELYNV